MQEIKQALDSREVAKMVEKEHKYLLRDIRKYSDDMTGAKISPVEFFKESTYKDAKGENRHCYLITMKGCEFIAHKLTGTKGTIFTARYINRFLYPCGIMKALRMIDADPDTRVDPAAYEMIQKGAGTILKPELKKLEAKNPEPEGMADRTVNAVKDLPITINIIYGNSRPVAEL